MSPRYYYSGPICPSKLPKGPIRSAIECFHNQRRRCYTKTNPRYKDNGALGITVDYTLREFVGWYLEHIKAFDGKDPSVGRIDHSKSYSLTNIRIESLADNSMERIIRVGPTRGRRRVIIYKNGSYVGIAGSLIAAERSTGACCAHIPKYCEQTIIQSRSGYSFRWYLNNEFERIITHRDRKKRISVGTNK